MWGTGAICFLTSPWSCSWPRPHALPWRGFLWPQTSRLDCVEPAAGGGQFTLWYRAQAMTASHRLPRFRGISFHLYWVRLLLVQVLGCEFWKLTGSLVLTGRMWGSPGARGEAAGPDSGRAETRAAPDIHGPSSMIFNVQPLSVCSGPRF